MRTGLARLWGRAAARLPLAVLTTLAVAGSCSREDRARTAPSASPSPTPGWILDFPEEIQADEPAVNSLLQKAIQTCAAEDYEAFRLLWSARQEPPTQPQFEKGWKASRKIHIEQLRKMRTAEGEIVYGVKGRIEFDPASVPRPNRDVVLLVVKEDQQWRLARAPAAVRKFLKGPEAEDSSTEDEPLAPPADRAATSRPADPTSNPVPPPRP